MASRLSSLTFPSFSLDSYGPDGKSYFATAAGPAGGPSSLLSLAVDSYGMRYFKLDMGTTCVNLGSALQSLGVTMAVPATSFTLCNLVVTRVPAVSGVPDVVLPDATTMAPSFAASFIISIPELGFNNVAARIATSQSTPSTVQIQVSGAKLPPKNAVSDWPPMPVHIMIMTPKNNPMFVEESRLSYGAVGRHRRRGCRSRGEDVCGEA
eukprot:XP_001700214.1 predicted protein [Chlamydomonas reinhardtii]